jgi:hypothetical protein
MAEHPVAYGLVGAEEDAAHGMALFGHVAADERGVRDPREPGRAKSDRVDAREQHAERRVERDREHGGDRHREVLREGERPEEPALLVDEGEHRQERHGDHEQREEDRGAHLLEGTQADLVHVAVAAAGDPLLDPLVSVLHLDDRAVDEDADRDRDAGERHDVRREAEEVERDERENDRDRDRDDRDDRRRDVPEEHEDDEAHDQELLAERVDERVDGAADQVGAVVRRDDLDAGRERRAERVERGLHAIDDGERVLALAHDHDAADRVAEPVEVGDAASHVGADRDRRHVFHEHRRARLGVAPHHEVLEVVDRAGVAAPAHHELRAGELEEPTAGLRVPLADRVDERRERHAVGEEARGIGRHLILPHEAADGGDLRDARDGLQLIAKRPVLQAPERRQVVGVAPVDERVLEHPADARRVGADLGLDAGREARLDLAQVLEDARAGPVEIGPVLEDDVDVRVPEVGHGTDGLHVRRPEERRDDRIRHLVLDDVGAPVPAREDDDLRVGEVGDRVQRDVPHAPRGRRDGDERGEEHEAAVVRAVSDDARDHRRVPVSGGARARRRRASGRMRRGRLSSATRSR